MFGANPNQNFNIYGANDDRLSSYSNVEYLGSYPPDELPSVLNGRYGLVWDGDEIKGCSGTLGNYTRINNPHKLSLYIASGIPVIVWKEAAIAEFVKNNGIGIVTERVSDLKELLQENEREYVTMKECVLKIRNSVITGEHLSSVLKQIERVEK